MRYKETKLSITFRISIHFNVSQSLKFEDFLLRNVDAFLKKNKDWKYANHLFEEKANKKVANCIRKEIVRKFKKGNGFKFSEHNNS